MNAANGEKLNSILTKSVPGLQEQTLQAEAGLNAGVSDIEKEEVASRVGFASKLAKAMAKGKQKLERALNAETHRQEGEVKDWIAHTSETVKQESGEVSALEVAMRKGSRQFGSEAERLASELGEVQLAAKQVNTQVNAQLGRPPQPPTQEEDERREEKSLGRLLTPSHIVLQYTG